MDNKPSNQPTVPPLNANPSNNPAETSDPDYDKPVAYDQQGRPLYAHPAAAPVGAERQLDPNDPDYAEDVAEAYGEVRDEQGNVVQSSTKEFREQAEHQYVHVRRPIAPKAPDIPPEILARSEESRRRFPQLNLSQGEFVISAVKRHPIGLLQIWGAVVLLIAAMAGVLVSFFMSGNVSSSSETITLSAVGLGLLSLLILLGGVVATYIYNSNRFYLTNESVIQEIQIGLFNKHEQTVSLANIEDASYYQSNIFSYIFDFGTIRLSTEGDETTYRFSYVAQPKRHLAVLNNAVEAFKNGRPVIVLTEDEPDC